MKREFWLIALAVVAAASVTGAAAARQEAPTARGRAYSLEGAWLGTASIIGLPPMPTMDTFTSNAAPPMVAGTFLCTIPPGPYPNPLDPSGWLSVTPSGQGNWKWVARNEYAFTAWRIVMDQTGAVVGTAKYWGVITPLSPDEYSGTMNAEFYRLDGSLLFPVTFTGTLSSNRIEIVID
jgi:hypothetical protein